MELESNNLSKTEVPKQGMKHIFECKVYLIGYFFFCKNTTFASNVLFNTIIGSFADSRWAYAIMNCPLCGIVGIIGVVVVIVVVIGIICGQSS